MEAGHSRISRDLDHSTACESKYGDFLGRRMPPGCALLLSRFARGDTFSLEAEWWQTPLTRLDIYMMTKHSSIERLPVRLLSHP